MKKGRECKKMEENGFFGTAFRGFRKEDVLNYIDTLNASHCEEITALQQQNAALQQRNGELETALPPLQKELEALRGNAAELERVQKALEIATQRLTVLEEENRQQRDKLQNVAAMEQQLGHLKNETAVQQQQLAEQQQQLSDFEQLFGDSRDAATFVKDKFAARLQSAEKRTADTVSAVEKMTDALSTQLQQLREQTAAIRNSSAAASAADEQEIQAWLARMDADTPPADTHFFR